MAILDGVELTLIEKAIKGMPLPERLNLADIAELWTDNEREREIYRDAMLLACKAGKLKCEIDKEEAFFSDFVFYHPLEEYWGLTTTANDFLSWLESQGEPKPIACLLTKWWGGEQPEPSESPLATKTNNEMGLSGLLKAPQKQDYWFDLIDDMTREFYITHNKKPNETQAWGQLCTTPPAGYFVTACPAKDKYHEDYLEMPGQKPLSRSAFTKRWAKYNADNT